MLNIVATKRQVISTDIICSLVLWEPTMAWQIRRSCTICGDENILTGKCFKKKQQMRYESYACIYSVLIGQRKPLSLWASPRTPIAPCRWRIPGRAPHETGSGWTQPSLWVRSRPPRSLSWIQGSAAGQCGQRDPRPWSGRIHQSANTTVEFAGPDWSAWSGIGKTRGWKDVERAKEGKYTSGDDFCRLVGRNPKEGRGTVLIGSGLCLGFYQYGSESSNQPLLVSLFQYLPSQLFFPPSIYLL